MIGKKNSYFVTAFIILIVFHSLHSVDRRFLFRFLSLAEQCKSFAPNATEQMIYDKESRSLFLVVHRAYSYDLHTYVEAICPALNCVLYCAGCVVVSDSNI